MYTYYTKTGTTHYLERLLISALNGNDRGPYSKKIILSAVDYTFALKFFSYFQSICLKMDAKFKFLDLNYL